MSEKCKLCDRPFPHYHTEMPSPNGEIVPVIVSTFPDIDPRAEVRDSETGEMIFPATKGPLRVISGGREE